MPSHPTHLISKSVFSHLLSKTFFAADDFPFLADTLNIKEEDSTEKQMVDERRKEEVYNQICKVYRNKKISEKGGFPIGAYRGQGRFWAKFGQ